MGLVPPPGVVGVGARRSRGWSGTVPPPARLFCGAAAMPTMARLSRRLPVEPKKAASPKEKMPPSVPTSQ